MIDCKVCEIGKVLEHPVVFERVECRIEKFLLATAMLALTQAKLGFDTPMEIAWARVVVHGNECALHERGAVICSRAWWCV